jgi:hypothetical protein
VARPVAAPVPVACTTATGAMQGRPGRTMVMAMLEVPGTLAPMLRRGAAAGQQAQSPAPRAARTEGVTEGTAAPRATAGRGLAAPRALEDGETKARATNVQHRYNQTCERARSSWTAT